MALLTMQEYLEKKKKDDELQHAISYVEYMRQNEIAPVKLQNKPSEITAPSLSDEKDKDEGLLDFFQKGAFEDGYQFGDVTKSILGTTGDAVVGVAKGIGSLGEGIVDLGKYGVAGVADVIGKDKYAEQVRKNAQENSVEEFFKGTDDYLNQYSVLGRTSDAVMQGVGQVGAIILTGGVAGALGAGAVGATVATSGLMGLSSAGSGMSEAYKGGATDKEATIYGISKGVIDAGSELIFGGLGKAVNAVGLSKGISSLDDVFAQKLSSKLSNQVAKNFAEFGVKASAEGFEEVIAGLGSAVAKKLTYMDEEELGQIIKDENLLEQFVVGTVTSGMIQSGYIPGTAQGSLKEANETGKDFITGYTQNEQAVIDKEVENRIKEKETDNKKLTNKEITAIEEAVKKDLDKGYIDIDTIESTLGGETYNKYKSLTEQEETLTKKLEELEKAPNTVGNAKKYEETQKQLEELKNKDEKTKIKEQLSKEVKEMTLTDRLSESYNEKSRRSQAFEADLTKYDAKQQEVIKKATESGILNNTNRTHEFVDMVAKISADKGVSFDFTNNAKLKETGFALEGKTVNGYVKDGNIAVNIDSAKALNTVVGHEITHVLEGTELYTELQNVVKEFATKKGEYQTRYDALAELYKDVDGAVIENELTADLVGEYLFTDSDFVSRLSVEKPNIFQKIYEEIKYLAKLVTGSKEARELEKVKHAFDKAYRESANTAKDINTVYSMFADENIIKKAEEFKRDGYKNFERVKITDVTDRIKADVENLVGFHASGYEIYSTTDTFNHIEKRHGENGQHDQSMKDMRDVALMGYVLNNYDNAELVYNEKGEPETTSAYSDKNGNHSKLIKFSKEIDGTQYVVVATPENKYKKLWVLSEYKTQKKDTSQSSYDNAVPPPTPEANSDNVSSKDIISDSSKNASNIKYSLSDTKGRNLTEEQQEYFKDSKVRDENGQLKVMYHGSPAQFTVFDKKKAKSSGFYGRGFYFSESESHAGQYGGRYEVYLDLKNPVQAGIKNITKEQLRKFVAEIAENEDYGIENYGYDATVDSVTNSVYGKDDFTMLGDLNATSIGDMVEAIQLFNEVNGTNYDGIIASTETVAFYPEQIKNIGNQNPTDNPDINLSLGEESAQTGDYRVYGKDIALEAHTQETAQEGVAEIAPTTSTVEEMPIRSDYAPLTEDEAKVRDDRQIDEHYFLDDMPTETEEEYNGSYADHMTPADPFYEKDIWEVGRDRKQKAYMYENPEVKPFFQQEARYMLGELDNSQKGEKFYNDQLYYDTNGEMGFFGTKRLTSEDIAYLLDTFNYTYKDIAKGLNAIIEDNGKENNAISKRIEFLLDERLRTGYTDFWFGDKIPPNQDYINLLNSKEITQYNDESWNNWLRGLSDDDIKYLSNTREDIAPPQEYAEAEPEYLAIRPEQPKGEPRMARVKPSEMDAAPVKEDAPVAQILTEEPTPEKKKSRFWEQAAELVADKGFVFENLSKTTNNRELEAKWNFIRYADSKAQDFIGNGADGVKSLDSIQKEVNQAGITKELYEYLYHLHNIDRMSLSEKYDDTENKPVFGDSVTADVSRSAVAELEARHPELKRYANEIYSVNNYLRNLLVEGGVISQETSDLWSEMYPHYVPIRRAGEHGLDINVPLDTGRTGVNAPLKRATGGSSDILPLFDTMAQRALQTYKAVAKNRFGVELKNTLGTTIGTEAANVDSVIDGVDQNEELLQKGKNGRRPTFTVFEGGEKVTFEITDTMYDALKPTSEALTYTNKIANTISNAHRGVLTEYNPSFLARNFIKDTQDVLINSQHPAKTYANFPKAMKEMTTKGKWYTEYVKNGGEQNTYFDKKTNTYSKEEKSKFIKAVGMPLNAISTANNFIEKLPRLAEYIASREAGRSIEVSMLDSARVTTNFAAGGDLTKFLNRNGATFLNASVQGVMQQVRNVREAKMNGLKGWAHLAGKCAVASIPAIILNNLMWDDDDEYEELSDYVKQNYYVVAKFGDGKFVRIPKGRTLAVIQDALEQTMNALSGNDEADLASFTQLVITNLAPNNPIEDNILAPVIQAWNNETWYGDDLVPTRLQDLPSEEQYDESTDSLSVWLGERVPISPYKINYLLNQYSGAVGDSLLPMITPEAESEKDTAIGKITAPIRDAFTTDSVLKNQNVSDFYDKKDELVTNAKRRGATDEDILSNKYFNSINTEIGKLYGEKREIQSGDYTDSEKYYLVKEIQKKINALSKEALNEYDNVTIDGSYATVGGKHYRLTDEGWEKLSDEEIEKQNDVIRGTGITPNDYWSFKNGVKDMKLDEKIDYVSKLNLTTTQKNALINGETDRKEPIDLTGYENYGNFEEFELAKESPKKYFTSKIIGYDDYVDYMEVIGDIRADKDSNGKTINGSAKRKKTEYINSLDLDYGQRIILYRSLFDSEADKDTYNADIVEYLNSRDDISGEEMIEILESLDMKVHSDGRVTW